jgi:hypothetical protein
MPDRATTQVVAKAPAPRLIAVPGTGEALDLDAATPDDLAEVFDTAQQAESALRGFRRLIGDELLARMDHDASYTHRSQHWEVKGEGPRGYAYDGKTLWIALSRLVLRHAISADAARAAVRIDEVYTPRRRGV